MLHDGVLGNCWHVMQGTQPPRSLLKNSDFVQKEPVWGGKDNIKSRFTYLGAVNSCE